MQHPIPYLSALPMVDTSLLYPPSVLAMQARNLSHVLKDIFVHKKFGRMAAHGVAFDLGYTGFKK